MVRQSQERAGKGKKVPRQAARLASSRGGLNIPDGGDGLPSTLAERTYRSLKRDIVRGTFQAGEALNEKLLAKRYRGSRTPVREAIMRLHQEQLVRIVSNKGYFVAHVTLQEMNEMYEYRTALEGLCAELAARRWTDQHLLRKLFELAKIEYRTDDRQSYEHFIEVDTQLHVGIAKLTRNRLLVRAIADLRCQMERIMYAAIDINYYGEVPPREHRAILEAISKHNPEQARKLMIDHVISSKDKVLQLANGTALG